MLFVIRQRVGLPGLCRKRLTFHHLLYFLPIVKSANVIPLTKTMQGEDVKPRNSFEALDGDGALVMLNREVRSDGARPIPNEGIRGLQTVLVQQLVKQIVQRHLHVQSYGEAEKNFRGLTFSTPGGRRSLSSGSSLPAAERRYFFTARK